MSAPSRSRIPIIIAATLATALLSACDEPAPLAATIRPVRAVRAVTVELLDIGQALSQTGEIQPRYESDLVFGSADKFSPGPSMSRRSSEEATSSRRSTTSGQEARCSRRRPGWRQPRPS
jgi:hypothetical protein